MTEPTWWVSGKELADHLRLCAVISHGLLVADVNSSLPEVEEKPSGWQWVEGDGWRKPGIGEPG
jgi:hypothetical protein